MYAIVYVPLTYTWPSTWAGLPQLWILFGQSLPVWSSQYFLQLPFCADDPFTLATSSEAQAEEVSGAEVPGRHPVKQKHAWRNVRN